MTDIVQRIRRCDGDIPKQWSYEAANYILQLESQLDSERGHRAADRDEAMREIERLARLILRYTDPMDATPEDGEMLQAIFDQAEQKEKP